MVRQGFAPYMSNVIHVAIIQRRQLHYSRHLRLPIPPRTIAGFSVSCQDLLALCPALKPNLVRHGSLACWGRSVVESNHQNHSDHVGRKNQEKPPLSTCGETNRGACTLQSISKGVDYGLCHAQSIGQCRNRTGNTSHFPKKVFQNDHGRISAHVIKIPICHALTQNAHTKHSGELTAHFSACPFEDLSPQRFQTRNIGSRKTVRSWSAWKHRRRSESP